MTGVTVVAGSGSAWWIVVVVVEIGLAVAVVAWAGWLSPDARLSQTWRRLERAAKQQGKALDRYNTRQAAKYSPARKAKLLARINGTNQ